LCSCWLLLSNHNALPLRRRCKSGIGRNDTYTFSCQEGDSGDRVIKLIRRRGTRCTTLGLFGISCGYGSIGMGEFQTLTTSRNVPNDLSIANASTPAKQVADGGICSKHLDFRRYVVGIHPMIRIMLASPPYKWCSVRSRCTQRIDHVRSKAC
jgi:hypothetical protein